MTKSISIFGSTGSIGKNTIEVIMNSPESYKIVALVAGSDVQTLISQAKALRPMFAVIAQENSHKELELALEDFPEIHVLSGDKAINEVAKIGCDLFICAIVGMAALMPTIEAIRAGSNIGLANKECLVSAGDIILEEAKKSGSKLIPIDSEHNAIFQIFENDNVDLIQSITITASGGPFLNKTLRQMKNATKEQAVKHPNWSMGAKISIDSATMMNKGLEMIEAYRLFPVSQEQINIVVHPQSIIHGMVSYKDGSTLAMLSLPDMKIPIANVLGHPGRIEIKHEKLDLIKIGSMDFLEPDYKKFPAIKLASDALKTGGNAPCILNAANEIAVEKFLKEQISFLDITRIIMEVLEKIPYHPMQNLEEVIEYDKKARSMASLIVPSV